MGYFEDKKIFREFMINNKNEILLQLNSLVIGYKAGKNVFPLLPPLNAVVCRGELIALIGRNGTGKSTLLKTIARILDPLDGEIFLYGKNYNDYSRTEFAMMTGYVSTEQIKPDSMKVSELIELGRYPFTSWMGKLSYEDKEKISIAVKKTGISGLEHRFVNEISDGERQKVMIARLIAQDTGIMTLDEPTAFLDIRSKFEIIHLLRSLAHENKKTILFSTHDLSVVLNECDRIWLLDGHSLFDGAPEDLILNGVMKKIFDETGIIFNENDGSFALEKVFTDEICITGKGLVKYWTEKAAGRIGLRCITGETSKVIETGQDSLGCFWIYRNGKYKSSRFRTIYDLLRDLRK